MSRGACILTILAYLAAGGLGFVEVSCLCHERDACVLPLAEACVIQERTCGDCDEDGCPSMSAPDCPCGPCIDLLIASSLLLDLPAAEAGPVVVDAAIPHVLAPMSFTTSWSTPAGPSPPALAPPTVLRC